ncbi:MAG: discoidin domain-containing protein [Merdibacter sp.]
MTEYLDQVEQNLIDGTAVDVPSNTRGYIEKYWKWVIGDQDYTRDAADSPEEVLSIAQRVLDECVFTGELDPDIGNIALDREADIDGDAEGKTSWLTDGETDQQVSVSADQSVTIDLLAEFDLTGLSIVTADPEAQYTLSFSQDGSEWNEVQGTLSVDAENGIVHMDDLSVNARYVRVVADSDVSLSEIRVYGNQMLPTVEQLQRLIETAEQMNVSANPDDLITSFQEALEEARQAAEEASADSMNTAYWNLYGVMIQMDTSGLINVALNKPTTAHNDPSGNSKNVNDGSTSTRWDSGRLSATGKPYEDTITPGWVIDLEDTYEISEISLSFASSTIWYQYEPYCSMDQEEWVKIGEKKTETAPNEQEDTYEFEPQRARYVLMRTTNIQEDSRKRNGYLVKELSVKGSWHLQTRPR